MRRTVKITFERTDGAKKRLATHQEMTAWMKAALCVSAEFCVRFVGPEEGAYLNSTYRKKNRPTNVLTFDYAHAPVAKADIAICTDVVDKEACEQKKAFRAHLAHLLIHATLHAQGWDHATDREAEKMEALETKLMQSLGFPNPYSDRAKAH